MNSAAPEITEYSFLNNILSYLIPCINYILTSTTINSLPKSYLTSKYEETPVQGGREVLSNSLQLHI